ncbi:MULTISPECIES: hypothetical protein [unclassified Acinetobacter]|uniref:hypothetical protein n=1 Tax=unclassified Acinetobacter TaxID=196816 RepID=UPI001C21DC02|nr:MULTISPECIES: hypothetical protein [unclassified Acinetobacter]
MNKMTQAVLATVVLSFGLGSTAVYANQVAGKPGSHKPGKHGCGDKCDGKIDIVLDVPRHCDLDVETPQLTLAQTTGGNWSDAGFFNVSTNAPYRLNINAPNNLRSGQNTVPVSMTTTRGGKAYSGTQTSTKGQAHRWDVAATVAGSAIAAADAGTYLGTYNVEVRF